MYAIAKITYTVIVKKLLEELQRLEKLPSFEIFFKGGKVKKRNQKLIKLLHKEMWILICMLLCIQ